MSKKSKNYDKNNCDRGTHACGRGARGSTARRATWDPIKGFTLESSGFLLINHKSWCGFDLKLIGMLSGFDVRRTTAEKHFSHRMRSASTQGRKEFGHEDIKWQMSTWIQSTRSYYRRGGGGGGGVVFFLAHWVVRKAKLCFGILNFPKACLPESNIDAHSANKPNI